MNTRDVLMTTLGLHDFRREKTVDNIQNVQNVMDAYIFCCCKESNSLSVIGSV